VRADVPHYMKLREIADSDHDFLIELHNDPAVLRNMTDPTPINPCSHYAWWDKVRHNHKMLRLIFEIHDARVGVVKVNDIDRINQCCWAGGDIHKYYRGNGYAKYMWTLLLDVCFGDITDTEFGMFDHIPSPVSSNKIGRLGLHRVGLTTASYNEVGQRVYRQLGFKDEGVRHADLYRDGKFYDSICMYMLKDDWCQQ
jgi:RimJ/RimL family protein N-acetyltransferase